MTSIRRLLPAVVLTTIVLAAWEAYVGLAGVRPQVLPAPSRVLVQGWAFREVIWSQIGRAHV